MPTSDLPIELWLEILSYLPRSSLHRMMGVNRALFELALHDIYKQLRFISDDKSMIKTLSQLKHNNIANHVQQFLIRPAFLPGLNEHINYNEATGNKMRTGFMFLRNVAKAATSNPSSITDKEFDSFNDPSFSVLQLARKAIKSCQNLTETSIIVHDHALTHTFMSFLNSLWTSDSIGPNIRKLSLDTTIAKIPRFLEPLIKASHTMEQLEELDLTLSFSRVRTSPGEWHSSRVVLSSFFRVYIKTLTSLTISSLVHVDIGVLFEHLPRLPNLKKFAFMGLFNSTSFPQTDGFTRFISIHSSNLESLIIKGRPRFETFESSDEKYTIWMNQEVSKSSERLYSFAQLVLPNLRALEVGLRDIRPGGSETQLLPDLSVVTPNLTKLVITDLKLPYHRLKSMLDRIVNFQGKSSLEELSFGCDALSPTSFDHLSSKFPSLKALTIEYDRIYSPMIGHDLDIPVGSIRWCNANTQIPVVETSISAINEIERVRLRASKHSFNASRGRNSFGEAHLGR